MNEYKTSKRMFWCCTHVTLRKTEIPLFLEHNIEVVPEEVCTSVMNPIDGKDYDNEALHPVIQQWRQKCTLNEDVLNATRRARLIQRKGVISQQEKRLFNNYFDVIYIATDLDTAVEVGAWFEGDVVFRYFGFLDNLRPLKELTEKHTADSLGKLVFCPIFNSLLELEGATLFEQTSVVHGYIDDQKIKNAWHGWAEKQSACVVTHDLKPSVNSQRSDAVRSIIPLARHINIDLLGKNYIDSVPEDVRASFDVAGILPFEDYLERLLSSRLLIHPFGNRYHNHYTNIEACFAGIPILFLSENPLYNENILLNNLSGPAQEYGAFSDINELIEQAKYLFDQRDELEQLAKRQKQLLLPVSKENVSVEVEKLLTLLTATRHEQKMDATSTPFSSIPCSELYKKQEEFVKNKTIVPLTAYIFNDQLPFVGVDDSGQSTVELSKQNELMQLILPGGNQKFSANNTHTITLIGSAHGVGTIMVSSEVWANNKLLASDKSCITLYEDCEETLDFPFEINSHEDFAFVLYVNVTGNLNVSLKLLSHDISGPSETNNIGLLHSPNNIFRSWNTGKELSATLFAPQEEWHRNALNEKLAFGVNISRDDFIMLRLEYAGHSFLCESYAIELSVHSNAPGEIELCLESWSSEHGFVDRTTQTISTGAGLEKITINTGNWKQQAIIPVLFIKAPVSEQRVLTSLRRLHPEPLSNTAPEQSKLSTSLPVIDDKHSNDSSQYRFYGQFDPPVDQFLFETYFKDKREPGFFIECGAYDGRIDSSCLFFKETLGWSGVNVEASRYLFRALEANRPGETNVFTALSDKSGTAIFRNAIHPEFGRRFGNGSLHHTKEHLKELDERNCEFEEYEVPTTPFRELVKKLNIKKIDLFVLDVEGHEIAVLKGMKGSTVLPELICAEHGQLGISSLKGPMAELGYTFDAQSHVNSTWILNKAAKN